MYSSEFLFIFDKSKQDVSCWIGHIALNEDMYIYITNCLSGTRLFCSFE